MNLVRLRLGLGVALGLGLGLDLGLGLRLGLGFWVRAWSSTCREGLRSEEAVRARQRDGGLKLSEDIVQGGGDGNAPKAGQVRALAPQRVGALDAGRRARRHRWRY